LLTWSLARGRLSLETTRVANGDSRATRLW
jgi:hypothetical protein